MSDTTALWRWTQGFGRMGDLEGVFVATDGDVAEAEGNIAEFGEVLGKHSNIRCRLDP